MKGFIKLVSVCILVVSYGCQNPWDLIDDEPETINQNVWEALNSESDISYFVGLLEENRLDTLFQYNTPYTIFAPVNAAVEQYLSHTTIDTTLLKYHISEFFIQSGNVKGSKKIRTLSKKLAHFEKSGTVSRFDGIAINFESPLYKNGKYFILDQVAEPRTSLYEFFAKNNQVLKEYIDSKDSLILDQEKSVPIGFDDFGNTIYDTVSIVYNEFEANYFQVREEFRFKTATIVFPLKEQYEQALTQLAQNLKSDFVDYRDIPKVWQQEVLVPYLLDKGVFENLMEPEDFFKRPWDSVFIVKNILGDSVEISYTPVDKAICSNGYAYNYQDFVVPDSLYNAASRFELETLTDETGINKFSWNEEVKVDSDKAFQPYQEFVGTASNDTIVRVLFTNGYSGKYNVEFYTENLFPRRYLMIVRTHMDVGGIYDIYVNDELYKPSFDYFEFIIYGGIMPSVAGGYYIPDGRFNSFDMFVDNINEFSKAKIRFEYKGPGGASSNGLVIDYIDFKPVDN